MTGKGGYVAEDSVCSRTCWTIYLCSWEIETLALIIFAILLTAMNTPTPVCKTVHLWVLQGGKEPQTPSSRKETVVKYLRE